MPHAIDISAPMTQILWCSPAAAALTSARSARCACDGMSFMGVVVAMLSIVIWLEKRAARTSACPQPIIEAAARAL